MTWREDSSALTKGESSPPVILPSATGGWRGRINEPLCGTPANYHRSPRLTGLDGIDLRREPIEVRKATLAGILRKSRLGVRLNEHLEHPDGIAVFQHACKMGLEGIVSKRLGSRYRSGRSPDWLKF